MKKPIRVLYWGMSDNIGGIESFIINVYRNIDKSKVQIDFLLAHNQKKMAFEDEILSMGGKVYRVMYSESESFIKARTGLKNFFKEHSEFKAVHVHANFPYAFPLKYAKKAKIPVRILHSHNSNGDGSSALGIRKVINKIRDKQIAHQIKAYPNTYFACSDLAADYMFSRRKYIWIKNGIDLSKYSFKENVRKDIRAELGVSEECHVLGFVGRLREQKNPFFLIDIYREYQKLNNNSILIIAGVGELEEQLKEYARNLIYEGSVVFLEKRTDVERLYQAMDAFLLPSIYEGLPVVLVESQTAGVPSFTSDVVTKQIAVTDIIHYYALNEGAKYWAKQINKVICNYHRRDYSMVMERNGFDIKSTAAELENFYLSLK